jgi:hypothetical protein
LNLTFGPLPFSSIFSICGCLFLPSIFCYLVYLSFCVFSIVFCFLFNYYFSLYFSLCFCLFGIFCLIYTFPSSIVQKFSLNFYLSVFLSFQSVALTCFPTILFYLLYLFLYFRSYLCFQSFSPTFCVFFLSDVIKSSFDEVLEQKQKRKQDQNERCELSPFRPTNIDRENVVIKQEKG